MESMSEEEISPLFMKIKMSVASVGLFAATLGFLWGGSNQLVAAENDTKPPQYIYIGGEVKVPQRCPYSDDLTLGKAIKMAKGVTSKASDKVTLTRKGSDKQTFKLKAVQKGDATDVKLKPGDEVVVVPRKGKT
jgi:protein involved in polysaccharide export with SLBB domain